MTDYDKLKYQGMKNFTLVTRHLNGISDIFDMSPRPSQLPPSLPPAPALPHPFNNSLPIHKFHLTLLCTMKNIIKNTCKAKNSQNIK